MRVISPRTALNLLTTGLLVSGLAFLLLLESCARPRGREDVEVIEMPLFAHPGGCRECHAENTGEVEYCWQCGRDRNGG